MKAKGRRAGDSPYFLKSFVRIKSMMSVMLHTREAAVAATVIQ